MATPPPPPCSAGKGEQQDPPAFTGATLVVARGPLSARELLPVDDFMIVTATLAREHPELGWVAAEQRVLEALKFAAAVAWTDDENLVPSGPVDAGLHALILNTRIHARLGERLGEFIHHYPAVARTEAPAPGWEARAMAAIEAAGFQPERDLW
ncbi:hypothetical protein [Streptomyces sp. NRRL S-241]|uniref:hypothetical protein n=1 Tax=Streptomyces sp. NRRL S-241 TaxID=1463896 RepID=UPI000691070C|nr:hypothetical protein [Streptomyces sp. NRRL S-241]